MYLYIPHLFKYLSIRFSSGWKYIYTLQLALLFFFRIRVKIKNQTGELLFFYKKLRLLSSKITFLQGNISNDEIQ